MTNKILTTSCLLAVALAAQAQQPKTLTKADYDKAQRFVGSNAEQLVDHSSVRPNWMPDDQFWYHDLTATGSQYVFIDAVKKTRVVTSLLPKSLPTASGVGAESGRRPRGQAGLEVLSPDGKKAAYIKEYNLWVRDVATGKQTQLTTDGIKDFGYATDNAGWKHSDRAILAWSPDSRKIATFRQDQRKVSDMYLVTTNVGKPILKQWKYPLPGDSTIATIKRVIINVDTPKVITLQIPPDPHRATLSDDISSSGTFDDVDWNNDATKLAFVSTSRDHKQEKVRIADAATGPCVRSLRKPFPPNTSRAGVASTGGM